MSELAETPTPQWGEQHSRTVTWHDPGPTSMAGLAMAGIEYMSAMREGKLPASPITRLFGFELVSLAPGDVVLHCVADASAYNPIGLIHGGLMCTLLDSAAAAAVHSMLDPGVGFTSIDISVQYLRPVQAGDELVAHGWVVKPGRRVSYAAADIRDPDDRLIATATSSVLIVPMT